MKKTLLVGALVASLGLSACGVKTTLHSAVASLGASSTLQVHLTASAALPGSAGTVASDDALLKDFSIDVHYASANGSTLAQSAGQVNAELLVNVGATALVDMRVIGTNFYVQLDPDALAGLPGLGATSGELSAVQLLVGGRWFEIPASLVTSLDKQRAPSAAQTREATTLERSLVDRLVKLVEATPYTTTASGAFSQHGTLDAVLNALWPVVAGVAPNVTKPASIPGTYAVTLAMSGSNATGGSISITAPSGSGGDATVTLNATIAHADDTVIAPTGATVITAAYLKQLEGLAGANALGGLGGV